MRFVGQGWRALAPVVLVALAAACGGDGGTDTPVATGVAATTATSQTALTGAAVAQAPAVRVTDQDGEPMQGVQVTFVAAGGGTVATSSAATDAAGVASAGLWTLGPAAGTQTVTATAASLAPVQFSATAQARTATTVSPLAPVMQTALAGAAVGEAPAVRVMDQAGQPLAGVTVNFVVTAGGGTVGTATATTAANGTASANSWTLGAAGANTVTATVAGLTPLAFNATAQARVATTMVTVSATTQTAPAGSTVPAPPSVRVNDQTGQPLAGVPVIFIITAGGGTVTGATTTTNAAGVATVGSWTVGAGQNTLTANVAGLTPVQFTATGQPAANPPAAVVAVSPTTQTGTAGAPVAQAPTVRVNDAGGQPVAGVTVTFAVTAGGGTLGQTTVTTNAQGTASAGSWTLGAAGTNTVTATVAGLPAVTFTATASADPCNTAAAYTLFSTISNALTTADCRLSTGEYMDFYATNLPTAQAVSFNMTAGFDTWMEFYDASGDIRAFNDDVAQGNANSSIKVFAPAGNYFVAASSWDPNVTGTYQLSSAGVAGAVSCGDYWVVPGVTVNGQVQSSDCSSGGYYSDLYMVFLDAGETLTLRMTSTALDSYLLLYNAQGNLVAENDNGGGGLNSLITYTASAVSFYYIDAGTESTGETGAYALSVTRSGGSPAQAVRTGARPRVAAGPLVHRALPTAVRRQANDRLVPSRKGVAGASALEDSRDARRGPARTKRSAPRN